MLKIKSILTVLLLVFLVSLTTAQEVFDAARNGNFEKVKELVEKNSQLVNAKSNNGETLLHIAALSGQKDIMTLLVSKGSDVEAKDNANNTPLTNAVRNGHFEAVKILVEKGANVNNRGLWNFLPIQVAAEFTPKEIVEYLIDKGADIPFEQGQESYQLLNASCSKGFTRLFDKLLEKGFNLQVNQYTGNLLHLAAEGGSEKIVEALLAKGFKVMTGNEFGWSPLHSAAEKGNLKVVELLLSKGADINDRNASGQTPYNLADYFGHTKVCEFLLSKGADKSEQKFPELTGKYLGQKEPESSPRLFAMDIVSTKYMIHGIVVFSPDGETAYWSGTYPSKESPEEKYQILTSKLENGKWSRPKLASFSKIGFDDDVPFVTPDGTKMIFLSRRPLTPGGKISEKENIWFANRRGNSWSELKLLEVVNSISVHWQVSTDLKGNLYFGGQDPEGKRFSEIYCSKYENGKYLKPEKLSNSVNSEDREFSPYISPAEEYIIFSRASTMGHQMGLYISFLKSDGSWTEAQSITEPAKISPASQCGHVTLDGKYLFYIAHYRSEFAVFWVNTAFISDLKGKALK